MVDQRAVIISCDGHAAGRPEDYVSYIDPAYRGDYDDWVKKLEKGRSAQAEGTRRRPLPVLQGGQRHTSPGRLRLVDPAKGQPPPAHRTLPPRVTADQRLPTAVGLGQLIAGRPANRPAEQ